MQTDRRLINIKTGTVSRPTPIPRRASAHPEAVVKVRPRYLRTYQSPPQDGAPGYPADHVPVIWQYETSHYLAESSLASLSLFPVKPVSCPLPVTLPSIDTLDTRPPVASAQVRERSADDASACDLADIDTLPPAIAKPPAKQRGEIADMPTKPSGAPRQSGQSKGLLSFVSPQPYSPGHEPILSAQTLSFNGDRRSLPFNLFDRLRWWLLYPGHLESLWWSSGVVLLVGVTILLTTVTVLSLVAR